MDISTPFKKRHMRTSFLILLIGFVFYSCSKNKDNANGPAKDGFNPTEYCLIAARKNASVTRLFGVFTFGPNGKATVYRVDGFSERDFLYQDGHLKMIDPQSKTEFADFTIDDGQIVNTVVNGFLTPLSFSLQKIPEMDAFTNKAYSGNVYNEEDKITYTNVSYKFNGRTMNGAFIYELKNNAFAYSATGESLFVISNGKLLFSRSDGSHGELMPK